LGEAKHQCPAHRTRQVHLLRALLCGLAVLGVVGCYEIHEEVWIRDDGTVRYALDMAVPEFLLVTASQVDGGNADSVLERMRRPPNMAVEGDSVWNRDYLDRDLRHFVSERQISSVQGLIAVAAREEAREDSIAYQAARRDSIAKALTKGTIGQRYLEITDSLRQANPPSGRSGENPFGELTGYVLGGYQVVSDRDGVTRIRHIVFPKRTRSKLMQAPEAGDNGPSRRIFSGRSYSYRIHAPRILSTNGATSTGDQLAEWSFPMTDIADSVRTLEAVISLGK
jgi:hypothetical protein